MIFIKLIHIVRLSLLISLWSLLAGCTTLFFQPQKNYVLLPEEYGIEYEDVIFKSMDELSLHGWWFPASKKSKAIIVFLQGNSGNISTHLPAVHWLTKHQYDVFVFNYRGYGHSEGVPYLQGVLNDINNAVLYASEHNTQHKKLFVIGQSLGASMGVFSVSAMEEYVDGAIFVSPFSDYQEITRDVLSQSWLTWAFQWPLSFTINNDYRPLNYVDKVSPIPSLFVYSETDEVVPSSHIKALYDKAKQPKSIEKVVGSHNAIMGIQENRAVILQYLDSWSQ